MLWSIVLLVWFIDDSCPTTEIKLLHLRSCGFGGVWAYVCACVIPAFSSHISNCVTSAGVYILWVIIVYVHFLLPWRDCMFVYWCSCFFFCFFLQGRFGFSCSQTKYFSCLCHSAKIYVAHYLFRASEFLLNSLTSGHPHSCEESAKHLKKHVIKYSV